MVFVVGSSSGRPLGLVAVTLQGASGLPVVMVIGLFSPTVTARKCDCDVFRTSFNNIKDDDTIVNYSMHKLENNSSLMFVKIKPYPILQCIS